MELFFPDQRWASEGEAELGIGIVQEVSKGRVRIFFPKAGETRLYAQENAPLRRIVFKPGDTITDIENQSLIVERVELRDNLYRYIGQDRVLSEADLGDVATNYGVDDRLFNGDVDVPASFALRRRTHELEYQRRRSSINGFIGPRIDLIPHQLYIAHEVSRRYAPRVLLSDEVGLGKTIEACLILHRLLLSGRISRALIILPESLVHQWFVELLRRFNLWFNIFDEERCLALDESAPDGNPFLDDQLILCSIDFLSSSAKRVRQALSAGWDMLVVDEAHHLAWSVKEASPAYSIVELLSKSANGLLLLTATPEQLGLESHFARLRLLDPERYSDFDAFKNETLDREEIADIVEHISKGESLNASQNKILTKLFGEKRVSLLSQEDQSARDHLIEDLLDQYGPGRVIFRNTRAAMSGFPKRKAHLIPLEVSKDHEKWTERLSKEFEEDLKPFSSSRQFWFDSDPRINWLIKTLRRLQPQKILLICRTKAKVLQLEKTLKSRIATKIGIFHEDLTIVQRDRNAAWFSESKGAQLLLCSEIGSEGRNFQFAHHLILFDLPFHPELLEQRIGRLDRIGQSQDINIHIPYLKGSPQELLANWFHKGLNAFEKNLEGGNQLSKLFGDRLLDICSSVQQQDTEQALKSLISDTVSYQKELRKTLENGRDRLLEMNSFRPKVAEKLIENIRAEDRDMNLENFMMGIFEYFGVEIEDLAPRTFLLHPAHKNVEVFPSIPDEGISVTFDRKRALIREDVEFLSWDHPMVTGAIDMIMSLGIGSVSFGRIRKAGTPTILLEGIFVLETSGGKNLYLDRFLPPTPLRVMVNHAGNEVTDSYPMERLSASLIPSKMDELLDNDLLMETILPNMISAATEFAEELSEAEISQAIQRMHQTMDHEIARLKALYRKNSNIRPEEIELAIEARTKITELIQDARVRLDALQLIWAGDLVF